MRYDPFPRAPRSRQATEGGAAVYKNHEWPERATAGALAVIKNAMPGYRLGDTGTVDHGPCPAATGDHYYVVQMDHDAGGEPAIFIAGEIEPAD